MAAAPPEDQAGGAAGPAAAAADAAEAGPAAAGAAAPGSAAAAGAAGAAGPRAPGAGTGAGARVRGDQAQGQAKAPWRGVSLGGWLLLEPGPAKELFTQFLDEEGQLARCEYDLLQIMKRKGGLPALARHRETFIGLEDFRRVKEMGLNAVRVPFGYWIVLGSLRFGLKRERDPYAGPGLEFLDRAVAWAEECGLQVLLDLHGAPGGESGDAPCGRWRRGGDDAWHWRQWRMKESLRALQIVARRYCDRPCVTGLAVCNEPSPEVPLNVLCRFYALAVRTVREAGMAAPVVTVVLPVFQRSMRTFVRAWQGLTKNGDMEGVCFEVHWYHCFENQWHGMTFAQHLRAVEEHVSELRRYPIVVGEWSLALGCGAQPGRLSREELRRLFARAQMAAYQEASHGWFFWTWADQHSIDWDWQKNFRHGYLPAPDQVLAKPELPKVRTSRASRGPLGLPERFEEDPLEQVFDVPASDPRVRAGDTIYLRAFNGRCLDVEGTRVRVRYGDRGKWQQFAVWPARAEASGAGHAAAECLRDGDVVYLVAHTGRLLGVSKQGRLSAKASFSPPGPALGAAFGLGGAEAGGGDGVAAKAVGGRGGRRCAFLLRTEHGPGSEVRHRRAVFLQSLATSKTLAPNESECNDDVVARWRDFGPWQRFIVEKPLSWAVTPPRPRRRSLVELASAGASAPAPPATPCAVTPRPIRAPAPAALAPATPTLAAPAPAAAARSSFPALAPVPAPGTTGCSPPQPVRRRRLSGKSPADAFEVVEVANETLVTELLRLTGNGSDCTRASRRAPKRRGDPARAAAAAAVDAVAAAERAELAPAPAPATAPATAPETAPETPPMRLSTSGARATPDATESPRKRRSSAAPAAGASRGAPPKRRRCSRLSLPPAPTPVTPPGQLSNCSRWEGRVAHSRWAAAVTAGQLIS